MRSFNLLALAAVFAAAGCSSPATPADGGGTDGGGGPDVKTDVKTEGGDPNCPSLPDISGMTDMTIHVQEFNFGMANPVDLAGAAVRIEQSVEKCAGYIDGTTDAQGVAHIKVDTAKGPFDVTAAMANYTAVSIVNLTGALASPIITNKTNTGSSAFSTHTAAGAISGKKTTGNSVQVDAPWWATVNTTALTYAMNNFSTATQGNSPPLEVTALEIDNNSGKTGNVVNAVYVKYMGTGSRPNANVTGFDFALPGTANTFMTANVTVNWPAGGILKAADVANVGDPNPNDKHLGVGAVVVKHFSNPNGDMFCGVADTAKPTGNTSTVKIQAATSGDMQPTFWEASYYTGMGMAGDSFVRIHSTTLNNGGMFTVGQVNALDGMGTDLDNTVFAGDTMGYDAIQTLMFSQDSMGGTYAAWEIWSAGGKVASHHIPHLPKAIKIADIVNGTISDAEIHALTYEGGTTTPWAETQKYASVVVARVIGPLDQGLRP